MSHSNPKNDSCPSWGCIAVPGDALTIFLCKLRLIFSALGVQVQVHPLHPLATAVLKVQFISLL